MGCCAHYADYCGFLHVVAERNELLVILVNTMDNAQENQNKLSRLKSEREL